MYTQEFNSVIQYLFVFARLGAVMMFLPGFGEIYIPVRIRLLAALTLCIAVTPIVVHLIPSVVLISHMTLYYVFREILIGVFLALVGRILLSALQVLATILGIQSSLSSATVFNPSLGVQDNVLSNFFMVGATVLILSADAHYLVIEALIRSYDVFPPDSPLLLSDFADMTTTLLSKSFSLGVRLASPLMLIGTTVYVCLGFLNRLMPQLQVFFLSMPGQITLMLLFMVLAVPFILGYFLEQFVQTYAELGQ